LLGIDGVDIGGLKWRRTWGLSRSPPCKQGPPTEDTVGHHHTGYETAHDNPHSILDLDSLLKFQALGIGRMLDGFGQRLGILCGRAAV